MTTECKQERFGFHALFQREVRVGFDGGNISSDGGGVLVEKRDPTGQDRVRKRDQGKALAGKSTLNRLELTGTKTKHRKGERSAAMEDSIEAGPQIPDRYKKIHLDFAAVDRMLVELFL